MTCANNCDFLQWGNQVPVPFTEWKFILTKLTTKEPSKLSLSSNFHCRVVSRLKKQERPPLPRNQVFRDTVDSFLVSSPSNTFQSPVNISKQDVPKVFVPPTKRYISSFKTLVNTANSKQTQRLNYINDSVVILKLSKDHGNNSTITNSQFSSKNSILSMATTATTIMSAKPSLPPTQQQQPPSLQRLSPILKIEGQKRRIVHHDSSIIVPSITDISVASNSTTNPMATSTSSHPQTNASVFTYRGAAAGGNTVRQRTIAETTSNSLVISAERLKSNMSSSIRSTRQPLTATTTLSSTFVSTQQTQRNINHNTKSRVQQEKSTNSREIYEYPDPFTNCPQDILNKLAQLTKLQLETIDWEKKKRFTKKKPTTNGTTQGKDSP